MNRGNMGIKGYPIFVPKRWGECAAGRRGARLSDNLGKARFAVAFDCVNYGDRVWFIEFLDVKGVGATIYPPWSNR
jgi:hypothetical protein